MRRKGQNFLVDRDVLSRIADYAELNPTDSDSGDRSRHRQSN